jgi:hypothetical protein
MFASQVKKKYPSARCVSIVKHVYRDVDIFGSKTAVLIVFCNGSFVSAYFEIDRWFLSKHANK